jgi:hypothetical protein
MGRSRQDLEATECRLLRNSSIYAPARWPTRTVVPATAPAASARSRPRSGQRENFQADPAPTHSVAMARSAPRPPATPTPGRFGTDSFRSHGTVASWHDAVHHVAIARISPPATPRRPCPRRTSQPRPSRRGTGLKDPASSRNGCSGQSPRAIPFRTRRTGTVQCLPEVAGRAHRTAQARPGPCVPGGRRVVPEGEPEYRRGDRQARLPDRLIRGCSVGWRRRGRLPPCTTMARLRPDRQIHRPPGAPRPQGGNVARGGA